MRLITAELLKQVREIIPMFNWQISGKYAHKHFGERYGISRGASVDFLEHRKYFAGDDIRHIDWSASARSEQLIFKTYQEEISPIIEIIFDCSASMAVSEEKWFRNIQVLYFLVYLCKTERCRSRIFLLGDNVRKLHESFESNELEISQLKPCGRGLEEVVRAPISFTNRSIRIVVSDFMLGDQLVPALSNLFRDSSMGIALRILDDFELNPKVSSGFRLTDMESNEEVSIRLTPDIISKYKNRFDLHSSKIKDGISRYFGRLITNNANEQLRDIILSIHKQSGLIGFRT